MIKAIETRYKGYRFRSRLEARWAVFFDELGIRWGYEVEGYDLGDAGHYLPDFVITGSTHYDVYIEIKGKIPAPSEIDKMERLCENLCSYGAIFFGDFDRPRWVSFGKDGRDGAELDNSAMRAMVPFYKYSDEQIADAVVAARSARFEHGENPDKAKAQSRRDDLVRAVARLDSGGGVQAGLVASEVGRPVGAVLNLLRSIEYDDILSSKEMFCPNTRRNVLAWQLTDRGIRWMGDHQGASA